VGNEMCVVIFCGGKMLVCKNVFAQLHVEFTHFCRLDRMGGFFVPKKSVHFHVSCCKSWVFVGPKTAVFLWWFCVPTRRTWVKKWMFGGQKWVVHNLGVCFWGLRRQERVSQC
jgi:hypothetical protein